MPLNPPNVLAGLKPISEMSDAEVHTELAMRGSAIARYWKTVFDVAPLAVLATGTYQRLAAARRDAGQLFEQAKAASARGDRREALRIIRSLNQVTAQVHHILSQNTNARFVAHFATAPVRGAVAALNALEELPEAAARFAGKWGLILAAAVGLFFLAGRK